MSQLEPYRGQDARLTQITMVPGGTEPAVAIGISDCNREFVSDYPVRRVTDRNRQPPLLLPGCGLLVRRRIRLYDNAATYQAGGELPLGLPKIRSLQQNPPATSRATLRSR